MTSTYTASDLQGLPLFASLKPEQCSLLLDRHRESSHATDQVFVLEQDWGESLFLLCSGMAKVRTFTADGVEQCKVVLAGHLALLGDQPPQIALRQQTGKEGAALMVIKGFRDQRQRL